MFKFHGFQFFFFFFYVVCFLKCFYLKFSCGGCGGKVYSKLDLTSAELQGRRPAKDGPYRGGSSCCFGDFFSLGTVGK